MRYLYAVALFAAAVVTGLVLTGTAAGNHRANHLFTTLVGSEEVGGGDPDGSGEASLRLMPRRGRICFEITVRDVATIQAAHIHKAPAGMNGPIVVDLSPVPPDADDGHWEGCTSGIDPALVKDIKRNHVGYYVNVHNMDFPGGALRGQLD